MIRCALIAASTANQQPKSWRPTMETQTSSYTAARTANASIGWCVWILTFLEVVSAEFLFEFTVDGFTAKR